MVGCVNIGVQCASVLYLNSCCNELLYQGSSVVKFDARYNFQGIANIVICIAHSVKYFEIDHIIALIKAKIVYDFGLSECSRVAEEKSWVCAAFAH